MYPLSTRVRNQPPHSLLDRMPRFSMITVRLQRLCLHTLSSLSKIGGAHSHVLLAEGAGCVSVGGLACLISREARLNFAGRKSKTSNTAHQGSYHVRIHIYDVSIITLSYFVSAVEQNTSSTLNLQAHLVSSYIILPSSFVQHRPSTTKLIQQSPLSPRIQDELRPSESRDRGVYTRA